jgi:hypothetical protein
MKKIFTLVTVAVLMVTLAHAQTGWVDHKGDDRISVKFPVQPKEIASGSFFAFDKDTTGYIFTIIDYMKVAGMDSVALDKEKDLPEFAVGMKTGYTKSNPDVKIDDFKVGKWKGFTCYTTSGVDSKKRQWDMFIFIIGNKMYGLQTMRNEHSSPEGRDAFFNSVVLSN